MLFKRKKKKQDAPVSIINLPWHIYPAPDLLTDHDPDFDNSDVTYLEQYEAQLAEAIYEHDYQEWLKQHHAPKMRTVARARPDEYDRRRAKLDFMDSALFEHNHRGMYQNRQVE